MGYVRVCVRSRVHECVRGCVHGCVYVRACVFELHSLLGLNIRLQSYVHGIGTESVFRECACNSGVVVAVLKSPTSHRSMWNV